MITLLLLAALILYLIDREHNAKIAKILVFIALGIMLLLVLIFVLVCVFSYSTIQNQF